MGHKKRRSAPAPVPPDNQPVGGPPSGGATEKGTEQPGGGAGFNEQDPKRRLGNYGTAGEHPYVQPGGRNDANH